MRMTGKREIGHTEARVNTLRYGGDRPLPNKWTGLVQADGEEAQFTTNCQELIPGERYPIVYERTEIRRDDSGIKIPEIIQ